MVALLSPAGVTVSVIVLVASSYWYASRSPLACATCVSRPRASYWYAAPSAVSRWPDA